MFICFPNSYKQDLEHWFLCQIVKDQQLYMFVMDFNYSV